jgi:hypothetical protein
VAWSCTFAPCSDFSTCYNECGRHLDVSVYRLQPAFWPRLPTPPFRHPRSRPRLMAPKLRMRVILLYRAQLQTMYILHLASAVYLLISSRSSRSGSTILLVGPSDGGKTAIFSSVSSNPFFALVLSWNEFRFRWWLCKLERQRTRIERSRCDGFNSHYRTIHSAQGDSVRLERICSLEVMNKATRSRDGRCESSHYR